VRLLLIISSHDARLLLMYLPVYTSCSQHILQLLGPAGIGGLGAECHAGNAGLSSTEMVAGTRGDSHGRSRGCDNSSGQHCCRRCWAGWGWVCTFAWWGRSCLIFEECYAAVAARRQVVGMSPSIMMPTNAVYIHKYIHFIYTYVCMYMHVCVLCTLLAISLYMLSISVFMLYI